MPFGQTHDNLAASHLLLDQLGTFAQMELRADRLGIRLATLRQRLARAYALVDADEWAGQGSLAVAHDHPVLRAIAVEILEGLGYRVFAMDRRMADWPEDTAISAILLDVPLLNEEHLEHVWKARQKSPRVVVSTLLPEGLARQRLREDGVVGFVAWPLDRRELAECLRSVLTKADACLS